MESSPKFVATLGLVFCLLSSQVLVASGDNQTVLVQHLFDNYEKDVRPVCGQSQPIEVRIGVAIRQIIDLDEPKQILHLNTWLRLSWSDCHLQWTPSDYGNTSNLVVPYDKVWTPDITLYDNAVGTMVGLKDYRVTVYSDGSAYYNFPSVISVMCKMDVTYFPFDMQKCALKFGSWAYHGLELDLTNRTVSGDISSLVPNSEFDITSMPLERHVVIYGCCPEPYPDVTFYVNMKRKPMFYVFNLMFPCILITAVALLGFILPPDAGEKISLEITVLLSLAVFMLVVSETLPPTSETFPYIGVYFAGSMMLVSLSTVLTVMVLNIHHKEYRPVPMWMKFLFFRVLGKAVCFSDETANKTRRVQVQHSDYTHQNGFAAHFDGEVQEKRSDLKQVNGTSRPTTAVRDQTPAAQETSNNLSPLVNTLNEHLRVLRKAEARKDMKQRHDNQCNEWRHVAIILDRVFLVIFALVTFITSLAVLVPLASESP